MPLFTMSNTLSHCPSLTLVTLFNSALTLSMTCWEICVLSIPCMRLRWSRKWFDGSACTAKQGKTPQVSIVSHSCSANQKWPLLTIAVTVVYWNPFTIWSVGRLILHRVGAAGARHGCIPRTGNGSAIAGLTVGRVFNVFIPSLRCSLSLCLS